MHVQQKLGFIRKTKHVASFYGKFLWSCAHCIHLCFFPQLDIGVLIGRTSGLQSPVDSCLWNPGFISFCHRCLDFLRMQFYFVGIRISEGGICGHRRTGRRRAGGAGGNLPWKCNHETWIEGPGRCFRPPDLIVFEQSRGSFCPENTFDLAWNSVFSDSRGGKSPPPLTPWEIRLWVLDFDPQVDGPKDFKKLVFISRNSAACRLHAT